MFFLSEYRDSGLKLNQLILEHPILHLKTFHGLLKMFAGSLVLRFPLVGDLFLLDHYFVCALFSVAMSLLLLKKLILQLGDFDIAFVVELIYSVMIDDLQAVEFRNGSVFLVTNLIHQLSKSFVF